MKPMTEQHLAILRRHMVEIIDMHFDLASDEIGKDSLAPGIRRALLDVPRHLFVPQQLAALAYQDTPLPIGFDKTLSQPFIGAAMVDLLDVEPGQRILEIGTGLGYQAALMTEMGAHVWSVEIVEEFAEAAAARFAALGHDVAVRVGDGTRGWAEHAPFDAVLVTAAASAPPSALVEQLLPGGRMVIPLGGQDMQQLTLVEKRPDGALSLREIMPVRFNPAGGGLGAQMLPEEAERALPGQVGGGLAVALGGRVVVERVVGAFVIEIGDRLVGGAQRGDPRPQSLRDADVEASVVDHQRRLDLGRLGRIRRSAVIDDSGVELVAGGHGEPVDERASPAKADRADLAGALEARCADALAEEADHPLYVADRRGEIEFADHFARLVLVRWRASGGSEEVRSKGAEIGRSQGCRAGSEDRRSAGSSRGARGPRDHLREQKIRPLPHTLGLRAQLRHARISPGRMLFAVIDPA